MAKEKDFFWQIQGLTSFCKARADWLEYDRIHLSFVKHEGKNNNCKQTLAIEGAVKLHGSDGVLYLSELILSGAAKKLAEKAKAAAGNGYVQPIFTSMGGTVSARSNNGQCMFRQFSVVPGTKSEYVLQMTTCPGEENATGGIQPVKGAKRESIYVPLTSGDLVSFAKAVQIEVTAFRTVKMLSDVSKNSEENHTQPAPSEQPAEQKPAAQTTQTVPAEKPTLAIIYETTGIVNRGLPFAMLAENGVNVLKGVIQALLGAPERYVCIPEQYNNAVKLIEGKQKGSAIVNLAGKQDASKKASIVVVIDTLK